MSKDKLTPLMEQYFQIRDDLLCKNPGTILFFQVGDFYELFFEDAKVVSSFLAIALTKRGKCSGKDIPLCGVPVHALRHYLTKLVKGGFKVAICEQLSEPKPGSIVERGVTQIFTPGTLVDTEMMDEKSACYILSFFPMQDRWGLAFGELLTTQLFVTSIPAGSYRLLEAEVSRFFPDEIVIPSLRNAKSFNSYFRKLGYWVSAAQYLDEDVKQEEDVVGSVISKEWFEKQFDGSTIKKLNSDFSLNNTLQLFFSYLHNTQKSSFEQFRTIQFYEPDDYLILDVSTQKNLEIVKNAQDGGRKNSLLSVLDKSRTAMGSRMVKKWLSRPLVQKKSILQRQEVVSSFAGQIALMQKLDDLLGGLSDLERIVGRIALRKATLNDYLALKDSLKLVEPIKYAIVSTSNLYLIYTILEKLTDFSDLVELLQASLNEDSSSKFIIKSGFDIELDRLRNLVENAQKEILKLEQKEVSRTKINSLKIRYNKVSGYSIEVTKTNLHLVPKDYIRQQTLSNRERYVTQELITLEKEINKAQSEIDQVEKQVFERVKKVVEEKLSKLRSLAYSLAYLDGIYSFAQVAYDNNYMLPTFNEEQNIIINEGRHPVVEYKLEGRFIANYTQVSDGQSLLIITGPNMGGKSTYLRQVALICIMAQCGSLVPAQKASLPILDRIFTRIGSGDNLAEGKSTFLVEMEETAAICTQATKNSLVILDEVGRGTSTYDGLAIAQAVIEFIYKKIKARCLFATHYHELTHLKDHFKGINNFYMACQKTDMGIVFLYKIMEGISSGSFGIEVAKLAELPVEVVSRAREILHALDDVAFDFDHKLFTKKKSFKNKGSDLTHQIVSLKNENDDLKKLLGQQEKLLEKLGDVKLDELSPRQAFDILWELKTKKAENQK